MITADLFDLIVVILVIVFAMRGYHKGLVNQLGALIALIVGGAISIRYTPSIADFMPGSGNTQAAVAFVVIVLFVTLIVWNIVNALTRVVTKLKLNSWNNQMGALLGVVNGIVMSMILTFLLLVFAVPQAVKNEDGTYAQATFDKDKSFIMNSKLGPYLTSATLATIDHLPQGGNCRFYNYMRDLLVSHAEDIKEQNPELPQTYDSNSEEGHEQGYDNQSYPSGYNNQEYPRNPGYPQDANYPRNPSYPNSGYPNQGYPQNPGYPNQGYPQNPSYPNQGYPQNQGYPNHGYPQNPGYPQGSPSRDSSWRY